MKKVYFLECWKVSLLLNVLLQLLQEKVFYILERSQVSFTIELVVTVITGEGFIFGMFKDVFNEYMCYYSYCKKKVIFLGVFKDLFY